MATSPEVVVEEVQGVLPPLFGVKEQTCSSRIPSPPLVPPAPPLPSDGRFPVKFWRRSCDSDSGCESYVDVLPGRGVSDDEFSEYFISGASSRATSRRSSANGSVTAFPFIPDPPSPPPIQFFRPRFVDFVNESPRPERRVPRLLFAHQLSLTSSLTSLDPGLLYGQTEVEVTCIVCLEAYNSYPDSGFRRACCQQIVCKKCLKSFIQTRLSEGFIEFPCPNPECNAPIPRSEVPRYLSGEDKARFERLRVNAEEDGSRKTCPHCCHITEHTLPRKVRAHREEDVKITCENCSIEWCFKCQAPWHQGISCKAYMRGNKQFLKWTKDRPNGTANCQKCPTCRVYIQRSTGCDHMTCNRCKTHFCYKCGGRFIEVPGLGDHYGRMSMFGCKYNFLLDEPVKRKALRGGYFGAKMAMLTGYPILFVAGATILVAVGAVALPVYGGYRLYKFKKNTRRLRRGY